MSVLDQFAFPTSLFLAALALTVFILLFRVQRYYGRAREPRPSWSPPLREKGLREAPPFGEPTPMVQWEVEMHETARKLSAQLDSKMGALEHLIREADRAAARLEAALAAETSAAKPTPATAPFHEVSSPVDAPRQPSPASQAEALRPESPSESGASPQVDPRAPTTLRPSCDRRYEEIYTLADYGMDPAEIAQRVGSPVGEVELILSLRGKR